MSKPLWNAGNTTGTAAGSSIRSILSERTRSNSKRGKRDDDFHLSLVIECGGMRGISAAGFLRVLSKYALLDSFDTLHGSSAGACAAAYFLANQSSQGIGIYQDIGTRRVVSPYRLFSQPCMVDTDYIVDEVLSRRRPLNVDRIIGEPGVLNIITTSLSDGQPAVHNIFGSGEELFRALKATLRVPGPFEYGIAIGGSRHIDGGISAPIPLFSAVAAGATHILVVCTQRIQDYITAGASGFLEGLFLRLFYSESVQRAYLSSQGLERQKAIAVLGRSKEIDVLVRPSGGTYCSWFTIDPQTLKTVEEESAQAANTYLQPLQVDGLPT